MFNNKPTIILNEFTLLYAEDGGGGELGTNNYCSSSTTDQINQVASLRG
jgi:hypothetical protein